MKVITPTQMQIWENRAIAAGVSVETLMRAAVAGVLQNLLKKYSPCPVEILCGKGNNGNDGILLGYELERRGWPVRVISTHPLQLRTPHPCAEVQSFLQRSIVWKKDALLRNKNPVLWIDVLLGLKARGEPRGAVAEILSWWKEQKRDNDISISLDAPSGLDPEIGKEASLAFHADVTYALGAVKNGCLRDVALPCVGQLIPVELPFGIPLGEAPVAEFQTKKTITIRPWSINIHKYKRGRVAIWAGSQYMLGAALLAARAATRSGAGLIKLYLPENLVAHAASAVPEIIARPVGDQLPDDFFECQAHVIGPGLGREPIVAKQLQHALTHLTQPTVLDADALYWLAQKPELWLLLKEPFILTPHQGEMERLIGAPIKDRLDVVQNWLPGISAEGVLIQKGAHTLIAKQKMAPVYNNTGHPAMATAGMGDVLSGLLGGLLAQGYTAWDAAKLSVYWHGLAGEEAARCKGERSVIASDVIYFLGPVWNRVFQK